MSVTRRDVIEKVFKSSVLTLGFSVSGLTVLLTPEQARARQVPLKTLSAAQATIVERLAETMVPGSVKLGVTHFVDHQLAATPEDTLLIAKYLQAPLPYADFYANGLKAADSMAQQTARKPLAELDATQLDRIVGAMARPGAVAGGFPIFLFYMCLRSDAVDVTYGTPEGFAKLNVPYMQHILPPETWNA